MADEMMCVCLVFLQLLDLVRAQCSATAGIVYYDTVHPMTKTPLFCAVTNAGVTQRNNKQLHECAYDNGESCENGRTDRGVVCGVDSGLPGIHELDGAWIPPPQSRYEVAVYNKKLHECSYDNREPCENG